MRDEIFQCKASQWKLKLYMAYPNVSPTLESDMGCLSYGVFHIFIWLFETMHIKVASEQFLKNCCIQMVNNIDS